MNRRHVLASLLAPLAAAPLQGQATARTPQGWKIPMLPRPFEFPRDHHQHPDTRTEWWYFTGRLRDRRGREFGFQLTFFRFGLRPPQAPDPQSRFLSRALPLGHFAISDPAKGVQHVISHTARGGFGESGFGEPGGDQPLCRLDQWSLALEDEGFRLRVDDPAQALDLRAIPERDTNPWVFHGEEGLSRKAPGRGHNSRYYSCTRLATEGTLRIGSEVFELSGSSWLDREWSSQLLPENIAGWDWFSLNLRDGRDLMLFQLRDQDGHRARGGHGTLVSADGSSRILTAPEFILKPLDRWRSPTTGGQYPVRWNVELPNERLQFFVEARFNEQELDVPPTPYWEGMVNARGQTPGHGYLEMTGYGDGGASLGGLRGS